MISSVYIYSMRYPFITQQPTLSSGVPEVCTSRRIRCAKLPHARPIWSSLLIVRRAHRIAALARATADVILRWLSSFELNKGQFTRLCYRAASRWSKDSNSRPEIGAEPNRQIVKTENCRTGHSIIINTKSNHIRGDFLSVLSNKAIIIQFTSCCDPQVRDKSSSSHPYHSSTLQLALLSPPASQDMPHTSASPPPTPSPTVLSYHQPYV